MTAKFQRRHYEAVAEVISKYRQDGNNVTEELVERFVRMFAEDNQMFKSDRFRAACERKQDDVPRRTRRPASRTRVNRTGIHDQRETYNAPHGTLHYTACVPEVPEVDPEPYLRWARAIDGGITVTALDSSGRTIRCT